MRLSVVRRFGALERAHERIRSLAAELTSTEGVARAVAADAAHHAAQNLELQDEACNLRREVAELRGERQQLLLESANHRERAAATQRMADEYWSLAVARGEALRRHRLADPHPL